MGLRLLVAGWQGQVARALVEAAPSRADIAACAIGRPALDICEPRSIARALADAGPDVVINAAAYTAVDQAEEDESRCFALNRDGAKLLAEAAARRGAAIIHVSTDYVFDGRKGAPYVETDPTGPETVYGRSKLAGEAAVREANPKHLIVRTAWVHSQTGRNFVKRVLHLAESGGPVRVVADRRGCPTYAPHFVDALLAIASEAAGKEAGWDGWGVYHAAGSGSATWHELAEEVLARAAARGSPKVEVQPIATADYPTRAPRPANVDLDCAKAERAFGVRLPPWREGVAACVAGLLGRGLR